MDADLALEQLVEMLKREENHLKESIADGVAETFDEYKFLAGQVRGLVAAQMLAVDFQRKLRLS